MNIDIGDYLTRDRLAHSLVVQGKVYTMFGKFEIPMNDRKIVLNAALLHDIGYSEKIEQITGFHPLDGYLFLKDKVNIRIAYAILMHSCAEELVKHKSKEIQEIFDKELDEIKHINTKRNKRIVDIVSVGNMLVDSKGYECNAEERHAGILERYGEDSYITHVFKLQMDKYKDYL